MWDLRKRMNSHTPNVYISVQMCVCVWERGCRPHHCQSNSISQKDKLTTLIDENIIKFPFPANELINLQRKQTFTPYFHMQSISCDVVCVWMDPFGLGEPCAACVCVCVCDVDVPCGCCHSQWVSNGNQLHLQHLKYFPWHTPCVCADAILWCSIKSIHHGHW